VFNYSLQACVVWWKNNRVKEAGLLKSKETLPAEKDKDDGVEEGDSDLGLGKMKKRFTTRWTCLTVAQHEYRDKFQLLLEKHRLEHADSLGPTNPASKDLMESLSIDDKERCKQLAKQYNDGIVPANVQRW
jgi:hypothetical protein